MRFLLTLSLFITIGTSIRSSEPWADPKMPVKDGLELWLDATRIAEKPLPDGKVQTWHDASGKGRHVTQSNEVFRPKKQTVANAALVRFDGIDDHLRAVKQSLASESFTVIAVVVPRANPGPFRGFFALNAANQRDYESGLNIDFGPAATPKMSYVNVEGKGFGGIANLRKEDGPFGLLTTFELSSDAKAKTVRLAMNGKDEGTRPRSGVPISMDEITIGGRFYNNTPGNQKADGFCRCDIAELLIYNRVLTSEETVNLRRYLGTKYAFVSAAMPPDFDQGNLLVPVKDPPPVQVLLPGFSVRELPVNLTNINNVKYRHDGTLVALGYDGNIWLLRDTDGDGVEDKADRFWENKGSLRSPIGMDLTPPGYKHGEGVFTTSEGRVVLIVDTDGDGKADKEIEVTGGWKERSVNIDVIGVAVDPKDHSIWFGRGTPNYTNGYLHDKDGKAQYSLKDERGTIQRVSPDFKSREIIATGIRFPVGLRFNRRGDLFCSDQEGATWLPNGNPFDELLHIQKGRHYGFPPRHPTHLPNVIDEPSTFDYGPQHQSTCGLNFNEPVKPGGPTFGPKDWADDVFMTGYSRGKLWRTKLIPTDAGYLAKNELFACLNMLTCDVCVTPDGSLLVACHSGGPDWGSGPTGKGKLYKISYTDKDIPQPKLVYPAGPREIRIAFDKPLDPEHLKNLAKETKVVAGKFVRAGDRFESLWPGYAVVNAEKMTPRTDIAMHSIQLSPDRRTLALFTDPLTAAVHYAVTLPNMGRTTLKGTLPQHPQIDLAFDLSGIEFTLQRNGMSSWSGWLPSFDLQIARHLTMGSAEHDKLWEQLNQTGTFILKTKLNLHQMLRPTVQPGSTIDYALSPESATVKLEASGEISKLISIEKGPIVSEGNPKRTVLQFSEVPKPGTLTNVELQVDSPWMNIEKQQTRLEYFTNEDSRVRPFPLHRSLVPWAELSETPTALKPPPELDGGSWAMGRKEFFGEQAGCAKCHSIHGKGETIGPDLSNLIHRDYASVLRDITLPSFAINPDHLTYSISLKDGRQLTGAIQVVGTKLRIGDPKGVITVVDREDVEVMKPSPVSTMPDDLPKLLGSERMKHLMTFLLTNPVSMPRDYADASKRPKPRTVAEVNAALAGAPNPAEKTRPIRICLVAGPKDHGPGEHDYPAWQKAWTQLLSTADQTDVSTAWEWPSKEEFAKADVMVFFQHGNWDDKRAVDLDAFLARGGGAVYIHWAVDGQKNGKEFAKRIGLAGMGAVGFRHGDLVLDMSKDSKHPVLRNFNKLPLTDETYWNMAGDLKADRVLATAVEDGKPRPQLWSLERERGRVFVSIPGHYSWTFDDPLFRVVLLRGIAWSAKEPVDRFNDLVWPGANLAK